MSKSACIVDALYIHIFKVLWAWTYEKYVRAGTTHYKYLFHVARRVLVNMKLLVFGKTNSQHILTANPFTVTDNNYLSGKQHIPCFRDLFCCHLSAVEGYSILALETSKNVWQ